MTRTTPQCTQSMKHKRLIHRTEQILLFVHDGVESPDSQPDDTLVHVRLESASTGSSASSLFLSKDATDLLFVPKWQDHHDPSTPNRYPISHVHIQIANQASQSYPSHTFASRSLDDVTGPSGIMIQVEFDLSLTETPDMVAVSIADVQDYFVRTVLSYFVGSRRVVIGPFGTSMQLHRLHRLVQCEAMMDTTTTIQCTTILPMEGTHAAFSKEGLRSFIQQAQQLRGNVVTTGSTGSSSTGGIWNTIATPSVWSQWLVGSGYAIPQSLQDATNTFAGIDNTLNLYTSRLLDRRMYWMDWRLVTDRYNSTNPVLETRYGLQYTVQLPNQPIQSHHQTELQSSISVSLNDILPSSKDRRSFEPDPFADASTIHIISPSTSINARGNTISQLEWGSACEESTSWKYQDNSTSESIRTLSAFESIDRTEPCFIITKTQDPINMLANRTMPILPSTMLQYWRIQAHIWRPYPGSAYRGTLYLMIQNQLPKCGTYVQVQQWIPAVIEPVWQSLMIRIVHTTTATTIMQKTLSWHQLEDYHVDFQQDGSYLLNFRHLLPEQSRLELFMDYDPAFLSIDHFPGDANRGFEIPPAQAEFRVALDGTDVCHRILEQTYSNHNHASPVITLYSNSVLLLAPLPDMSMPFNVLSFTCTLYVFVIGSLVNLLVKKISAQMKATLQEGNNTDSKLKILLRKMRTKLQRLFPQKPSKPTTD